jgi:hypothetical protein
VKEYVNRYKDKFTFTEDENHDILWEGNFEWCRFGMPNDYNRSYTKYCEDTSNPMSLESFKKAVHEWDDETNNHYYPEYIKMVDCLVNEIEMVDPSGGPYISIGMRLDSFGFKDYIVKDFKRIKSGYKIITEKCPMCHLAGAIHKVSCSTQKIIINIMQDDEKLGLYDN